VSEWIAFGIGIWIGMILGIILSFAWVFVMKEKP
jgi:hypothetical protein